MYSKALTSKSVTTTKEAGYRFAITVKLSRQALYRVGRARPDSLGDDDLAQRNGSLNGSGSRSLNESPNGSHSTNPGEEGLTALRCAERQVEPHTALNAWDSWDERIEGHGMPRPALRSRSGAGAAPRWRPSSWPSRRASRTPRSSRSPRPRSRGGMPAWHGGSASRSEVRLR